MSREDLLAKEKSADSEGASVSKKKFATLADLCGEVPERDHEETFLPRYEMWIKHRVRVPLDMLLRAQKRFMSGRKKNIEGYFVHMLKYLLLNPRITNDGDAQQLLKADGKVMLDIIGGAIGDVSDLAEEAEFEAGE